MTWSREEDSGIATHHPDYAKSQTKGGAIDEVVLQEFLDDPVHMHPIANAPRQAIADETFAEQMAAR